MNNFVKVIHLAIFVDVKANVKKSKPFIKSDILKNINIILTVYKKFLKF